MKIIETFCKRCQIRINLKKKIIEKYIREITFILKCYH